jgi:hypothetical protein
MSSDDIFVTPKKRDLRKDKLTKNGILTEDEASKKLSVVSDKPTKKEYDIIKDFTKHAVEDQHNHRKNIRKKPRSKAN